MTKPFRFKDILKCPDCGAALAGTDCAACGFACDDGGQMRGHVEDMGLIYVGTDISTTNVQEDLRRHGGPGFIATPIFCRSATPRSMSSIARPCRNISRHLTGPSRSSFAF